MRSYYCSKEKTRQYDLRTLKEVLAICQRQLNEQEESGYVSPTSQMTVDDIKAVIDNYGVGIATAEIPFHRYFIIYDMLYPDPNTQWKDRGGYLDPGDFKAAADKVWEALSVLFGLYIFKARNTAAKVHLYFAKMFGGR